MLQRRFNHGRDRNALESLLSGTLGATLSAAVALWATITSASAQSPAQDKIPALASISFAWMAAGADWRDPAPGSGHGPIKQDPAHPFHGNLDGPGQVTLRFGNVQDPVLKPWAAAQMQATNEEVLSGKRGSVHRAGTLLSGRRARATALSGGAVLFHPDPQRGVDDLAARPHGAAGLPYRQALG